MAESKCRENVQGSSRSVSPHSGEKKNGKTEISAQFEYNTYIRDFLTENHGRSLEDAIACWKYKKSLPGHNRYEQSDLIALD